MKRKSEKQAEPVDRFLLHARIKRVGVTQKYLASKLNRDDSAITRALAGENDTVLRRVDRHVTWLENRKQSKNNSPVLAAQTTAQS